MSLIVLYIELSEKGINKALGIRIDGSLRRFSFCPQRLLNLTNRQHGIQAIYIELRGVVESWVIISSLLSFTTRRK